MMVVLLKNENQTLPIGQDVTRLLVTGRNADDLGAQCGGWSITWQGGRGDITEGTSILEGIQEVAPAGTEISYSFNGSGAETADLVVVVVGGGKFVDIIVVVDDC